MDQLASEQVDQAVAATVLPGQRLYDGMVESTSEAAVVVGVPDQRTSALFSVDRIPFRYSDAYANQSLAAVQEETRRLERIAADFYGDQAGPTRKRLSDIDLDNPATREWTTTVPTSADWLELVPTAAALDVLYDPESSQYPSGKPIDPQMTEWLRNAADAHGIRSRAQVMRKVLLDQAKTHQATGDGLLRWLSLACGAAQPILETMAEIATPQPIQHTPPHAVLADADPKALGLARNYATRRGLSASITPILANVLDRRGFETLPGSLLGRMPFLRKSTGWIEQFDAVDAVGLLEYLQEDDWSYAYNGVMKTNKVMAGAVTFLRNAYACVKPGGMLVVGNMLDTHPTLGFTMDVIQWPHIQPRSIEEMLDIFEAAGLFGHVEVHLPSDGVYAVYIVRKPTRP